MLTSGPVADEETVAEEIPDSEPDSAPKEEAESLLEELADDLNPVADLGDTLRKVQSRYLIGMLVAYGVSTACAMAVVLIYPVRDWLLFLGMFLVILSYVVLYIKAHQKKRKTFLKLQR